MTLLFDSGVWVAAKRKGNPFAVASRQLVLDTDRTAAALDLTLYEVANVVGSVLKQPEVAFDLCRSIPIRCDHVVAVDLGLIESSLKLAAEHGLSAYDAAYVSAARRHGWTLVSTDLRDLVSKGLAVTPDAAV